MWLHKPPTNLQFVFNSSESSVLTVTKILIFDPYNRDHFSIREHLKKFLIVVHQTNTFNGKIELYWRVTPRRADFEFAYKLTVLFHFVISKTNTQ